MPIIKLVTLVLGCYQICSDDKIADINKRILQLRTTALNIDLMSLFEFTPVIVLSLSSVALSAFDLSSWIIKITRICIKKILLDHHSSTQEVLKLVQIC